MDHEQILQKIKLTKKVRGLRSEDIATKSGQSIYLVHNLMRGNNINLYAFIDIVEAMGLEINLINPRQPDEVKP